MAQEDHIAQRLAIFRVFPLLLQLRRRSHCKWCYRRHHAVSVLGGVSAGKRSRYGRRGRPFAERTVDLRATVHKTCLLNVRDV